MTAALAEPRMYVERLVGRQLSEAEAAIDVALLDRALAKAKNRLERAIHAEIRRAVRARGTLHRLELLVTDAMRKPLERLADLGRVEGWNELERLGYVVAGRRSYIDSRPVGPGDLDDYLRRGLAGMAIRIEDELVALDVASTAQAALVRAALGVPGARDIASRMVSTALIGGLAETFDTVSDLIACWEYTALLDGGTCDVCRPLNGGRYETLADLFRVLPNFGPNPRCLGGGRCRCRAVPCPAAESEAARLPTLAPFGSGFELPASRSFVAGEIQDAVDAADGLHGFDGLTATAKVVVDRNLPRENPGFYDLRVGEIHIAAAADHPGFTFLHEAGHFISHQAIGTPGTMAVRTTPELDGWIDAISRSEAIRKLLVLLDLDYVPAVSRDGRRMLIPIDTGYVEYLLEPEEVWARAYAQWAAVRSGDETLLRSMALERGGLYPVQWDDDDFEEIAAAIDQLMEQLGWAR